MQSLKDRENSHCPFPHPLAEIRLLSDRFAGRAWVNEDPDSWGGQWSRGISSHPVFSSPGSEGTSGPGNIFPCLIAWECLVGARVTSGFCGTLWEPSVAAEGWELPTRISPRHRFLCISGGLQPWFWPLQPYSPTEASESLRWGLKIWEALGREWIFLIAWLFSPSIFICRWNDSKMNSQALLKAGKDCREKQSQAREWSARWGGPCPPV